MKPAEGAESRVGRGGKWRVFGRLETTGRVHDQDVRLKCVIE